ncbi:MAG: hypothetical protein AAF415_02305 [Pseudomonadota bacterium]
MRDITLPPALLTPADLLLHTRAGVFGAAAEEDALLQQYIAAATRAVETALSRRLMTRNVLIEARAPFHEFWFPVAPISDVLEITTIDPDGAEISIDPGAFVLFAASTSPRLIRRDGFAWPDRFANAPIMLTVSAGEGADPEQVAPQYRQMVIQLAAHWAQNREPVVVGEVAATVPYALAMQFAQERFIAQDNSVYCP